MNQNFTQQDTISRDSTLYSQTVNNFPVTAYDKKCQPLQRNVADITEDHCYRHRLD